MFTSYNKVLEIRRPLWRVQPGFHQANLIQGIQETRERRRWNGFDGMYLELCEKLPSLCEISRTRFKHPLEFLVKRCHARGRHAGI